MDSEVELGTLMYVDPSNWKAPPYLPPAHDAVPVTVPALLFPELSAAVDPEASSRVQYPTRPLAEGGGADAAVMVKEADLDDPFRAAVTVAVWFELTDPPVTTKEALFAPAETEAEAGAVTGPEDVIVKLAPADGAASLRVAMHVLAAPVPIEAGLHDSEEIVNADVGADSVRTMVLLTPLRVAVMEALVAAVTLLAVALNGAELAPAGTVTEAGVVRFALLLDSATAAAVAAAPVRVTVHDEEPGAVIVTGEHETPLSAADGATAVMVPPFPVTGSVEPSAKAP
jgi:hypothetical protein